jgi:hypothetical protein
MCALSPDSRAEILGADKINAGGSFRESISGNSNLPPHKTVKKWGFSPAE